jgi:tRNA (guanine-N7-)-methyltransferase
MDGAAFWGTLFGSAAPVEIEIGSSDGSFLLAHAARERSRSLFGIERSPSKAKRLAARVERSGLTNVRTLQADAVCVVTGIVPDASVSAYHVYFPDPWPKRHHAPRRIFTNRFVAGLARTLVGEGRLYVATDVDRYAERIRGIVLEDGSFVESPADEGHPGLQTSFARKYRAAGRALHVASFRRVRSMASAQPVAASKIRSM